MAKRGGRSGRKYVRDSIGRFATTGATARGGRLKTKSGKKRATQTVKAKTGGKPAGAIKGKIKRDPGAAKPTARSKPTAARTSKAPANKAKAAYKRASGDARMRNADLRGADAKERRMANSASAKVKNMQRRRSTSAPKAGAEAPRSKQKAREFARIQRAYGNERRAYAAKGDGFGSAKQSRTASVAKRARDIYSGKISASYKTTSRLTRTQNPDVLKARIKRGEKLTAARAKKKSVTANSARATGKPAAAKPAAAKRKKTDLQRMQQADRIMGKLAKRQKAVVDKAPSLNEGLKQVRRNNARAARVNQSLASKGLLAKYTRLTAPADPIRMTPAGKGIPKSRKPKRRRS